MVVAKITTNSYGNLGTKGTRADNEMVSIDGVILCTSAFSDTIANLALEATWTSGIKAGTVMPLVGLDSYEDQSSEDTIYESALGKRKLLKRGKTRYMFQFDIPLSVHRTLMTDFNNADLRMFPIRDGKICFYNDSGTGKGFSTSMINIGRMKEVPADGSTPAFTPVYIDLANYREWDMYGEFIEPAWNVNDLAPMTDVEIAQETTPKSTSAVSFTVYAEDGYDSSGAVRKVYIGGLLAADIDYTVAADGSAQEAWTLSESNGVYTITATTPETLVAGKLTITPTSVTDGLIVKHASAAIDMAVA